MPEETPDKPKIIVDDDWKAQAQAEKAKLDQQAQEQPGRGGQRELPPADFVGLVNALASNIVLALGGVEDPRTGRRLIDLTLARYYIELLSVLEAKTKGNLSDDEKKAMDSVLYEVRMHYVQIAQRVSQV